MSIEIWSMSCGIRFKVQWKRKEVEATVISEMRHAVKILERVYQFFNAQIHAKITGKLVREFTNSAIK